MTKRETKDLPSKEDARALYQELGALNAAADTAQKAGTPFPAESVARQAELKRLLDIRTKADEAETLRINSKKGGPAAWFADVHKVTFLGKDVYVHDLLAERLVLAESALKDQQQPPDGWVKEGHSGLREPGQGLHSLGLAIDLNPHTNPWLVNPDATGAQWVEYTSRSTTVRDVIDRAVLLVNGVPPGVEKLQSRPALKDKDKDQRVEASYDKLADASAALKTYMALDDEGVKQLFEQNRDKDPQKRKVGYWLKAVKIDRRALGPVADAKHWTNPKQGFLDLDKRLVKAMTDSSGAALTWLGDDTVAMGRDIMHFDTRGLKTVNVNEIWSSVEGRSTNLGDG